MKVDASNRRLIVTAVVILSAIAGMFTTGTPVMWVCDGIAVAGALYVLATSPRRRGGGD